MANVSHFQTETSVLIRIDSNSHRMYLLYSSLPDSEGCFPKIIVPKFCKFPGIVLIVTSVSYIPLHIRNDCGFTFLSLKTMISTNGAYK